MTILFTDSARKFHSMKKQNKPSPSASTPPAHTPALPPVHLASDYLPALNLSAIAFDADNARASITPESLATLTEDIRRRGVLTPVWVRRFSAGGAASAKTHILIGGERRTRAALAAGLLTIPALDFGTLHDDMAAELADAENCQRENLTPTERARAYARMVEHHGLEWWNERDPAKSIGHRFSLGGKSATYEWRHIANLSKLAAQALDAGELSKSVAIKLARIFDPKARERATQDAIAGRWTDAEASEEISTKYTAELKGERFQLDDATLLPTAGSCEKCSFRSGNQTDFIGGRGDICGKPTCLREKRLAAYERKKRTWPGIVWNRTEANEHGLGAHYDSLPASKWIDITQPSEHWQTGFDTKGKPLATFLAGEFTDKELILAISGTSSGREYQILPAARVKTILTKLGRIKPTATTKGADKYADEEKARKQKVTAARLITAEVVRLAVDAAEELGGIDTRDERAGELLRILAVKLANDLSDDTARTIAKARNLEPAKLSLKADTNHRDMVPAAVAASTPTQLLGWAAELLCQASPGYDGTLNRTCWNEDAIALLNWLGLDLPELLAAAKKTIAGRGKGAK